MEFSPRESVFMQLPGETESVDKRDTCVEEFIDPCIT